MKRVLLAASLLVALVAIPRAAEAQKKAAKKEAKKEAAAKAAAADTTKPKAPWVAENGGKKYFKAGCAASRKLAPVKEVWFKTEVDAKKAGFVRSTKKGC